MNESLAQAEALFHAALELPAEKRASFLEEECDDPGLRERVLDLLRASEAADLWINESKLEGRSPAGIGEELGSMIGRYKLLRKIGEGGFGDVYAAQQQEPVRREVALKLIKLGMNTRAVIARFEAERQALALMDHPHIAKVLDAGASETGRPFFVMELVKGIPIHQYCQEQNLDLAARLKLIKQVCGALHHAHEKGIIHRDIKPSNVLVTNHDGVAHPLVIDFGVAKALNQRLTEKTLFTTFAQMIGTPAYMSPEQAEVSKVDADARTDIYSLGVLLYELITGSTPISEESLRRSGYAEMQRMICENDPERPSTRLSRIRNERQEAKVLRNQGNFPADLDWIVLKCLEKDRARRYENAAEVAADLDRLLRNEPIKAGPAGKMYRLKKLVHRKRRTILAGGLAGVGLIVGMLLKDVPGMRVAEVAAKSPQIDLSRFYNLSLEGSTRWQLDSAEYPIQRELQKFGENLFDIRGGIRLASPNPFYVNIPAPKRVDGIPVMQKCGRLHFVHFVFRAKAGEDDGAAVLKYVVHYAKGGVLEVPIQYGHHLRTWTSNNGGGGSADSIEWLADTNSAFVWRGTNNSRFPVRLSRTTWQNPRPEVEIRTIDLVSEMTDYSPVLVAITAER